MKRISVPDLTDLIEFIEDSEFWGSEAWEHGLTRAIPNWRMLVREPENWEEIEKVRPPESREYSFLCWQLIQAVGLKLAKRWWHSDVKDQKDAAKRWGKNNLSTWSKFDRDMKNEILTGKFNDYPGEPFETIKKYGTRLNNLSRDLQDRRLPVRILHDLHSLLSMPHLGGYIPSPQIEQLRFIVEDAGDQEYLDRIDDMIAQRKRACENILSQSQQQHQIPYSPNRNEGELIARLMEITSKNGYLSAALPLILISSETPPIFVTYPELEEMEENREETREDQIPRNHQRSRPETISIEELFGVYQPHHQQIVIYERGILWRRHRLDKEWLFAVVLIHEIAHWITHLLPHPKVPTWPTDLYVLGEKNVHEGWAQLITYWIADQVGGKFKNTFEELNRGQSSPYRVFEQFKEEPIDKMMGSLGKLRLIPRPARFQDWKEITRTM